VIVEFPSLAEAKAWYESPAYRAAREQGEIVAAFAFVARGSRSKRRRSFRSGHHKSDL
jgi:hypothetical protein